MLRRAIPFVALAVALVATPLVIVTRVTESPSFAFGDLRLAKDVNDDPRIVEVNLDAREATVELIPGQQTRVWAFGGTVPPRSSSPTWATRSSSTSRTGCLRK